MRLFSVRCLQIEPLPETNQNVDTTDLAAHAAWEALQGFYSALPQLDSEIKSKSFNLWTESYGG